MQSPVLVELNTAGMAHLRTLWRDLTAGSVTDYAIAAGATLALSLALWWLRDWLTIANFSLLYIAAVLLTAVRLGTGPSLLSALIAFLGFNFFLVQPFYTLRVANPTEVLDLLVFLFVAVITGQTAASAQRQAANAQQRTHEQEVLLRLTSSFNQLTTQSEVYDVLQQVLKDDLMIVDSRIQPDADPATDTGTMAYTLLEADDHIYGTLCVRFTDAPTSWQMRMLEACAAQAAAALVRIDLSARAQQSQAFEEADKLKTALLHAVSHDLRTPLTIIKSSASNLVNLHTRLSVAEQQEMVEIIEHEADVLNAMVGDLLDMSRLRAGALNLNKDWNSLEEIAGDIAADVWQHRHVERIKLSFPDDLPLASCDYGLILRALANLVDNALRYEPESSKVEIVGTSTATEVRVAVVNHGPSVPEAERERIMQPFYHGPDGHSGLGLAIAKGIVEAHDGRLQLVDTPLGGATFLVSLPRLATGHA